MYVRVTRSEAGAGPVSRGCGVRTDSSRMGAPVCHADDEQRQEQKHEVGEEDEEAGRWAGYSNGDPIGELD